MKQIKFIIFILLIIFQISVPCYMLINLNFKLNNPNNKIIRLECEPRDPYDFMRGRYVTLNFKIDRINFTTMESLKDVTGDDFEKKYKKSIIYCILEEKNSFYIIKDMTFKKPDKNTLFIKSKFSYYDYYDKSITLLFDFNKYYMQEEYAKKAEEILRFNSNFETLNPTLVLVVDDDGNAYQKSLEVMGKSIEKYIDEELQKNKTKN